MLTYYYTQLGQMICEERLRGYREPTCLGRPRKARRAAPATEQNPRSDAKQPGWWHSAARAIASLLM